MIHKLLYKIHNTSQKHTVTNNSKLILFSDCHRGTNSYADDFSHNELLYKHALKYYLKEDYTYYELGDGIELWENRDFKTVFKAHKEVFLLLRKFHIKNKVHFIWGNHDMVYKNAKIVTKQLTNYIDEKTFEVKELFKDITYHEGIVLNLEGFEKSILLIHGHQADYFNYYFWRLSRFLVRYLWIPLQSLGIKDPTSPAKNHKELIKVEKRLKKWISKSNQMVIAGHTHRPRFPKPDEAPYFNDGSCVHPNSITGIEIVNFKISLIKWHTITENNGVLKIKKTIIEGPTDLAHYLKQNTF